MMRLSLFLLIIAPLYSCNSQSSNDVEYKKFEDLGTGWTTTYPFSFRVMTQEEIDKLEGRGQKALESTIDAKLELLHKNLLWLKKDQFNSFTSNSQAFDTIADGSYEDSQEIIYQTLEEAYRSHGIPFDVKYGKTKIDNLEFSTMETTVYTPDRKNILMTQILYDRLINGVISLTLNVNYNNEKDKAALLGIISSTKLSKRN